METIVVDVTPAIKAIMKSFEKPVTMEEALKYSQAALNLAHVAAVLSNIDKKG